MSSTVSDGSDSGAVAPRGRRVRRSAEQRRVEIADAAREIALDAGLVAVTLRAVAARVGVASALISHYEPSMDDLVARTFAGIVRDELDEIDALVRAMPSARAQLRALLATLLESGRAGVTLVWVQAWALGERNEPLAAAVRAEMDAWEELIARLISDAAVPGDARMRARQLLGVIDGLNAHALVRWRGDDERYALLARSTEAILGLEAGALG